MGWYDRKVRHVRDLSCGDTRIFLELEVRRLDCRNCGKVKRERLDFLADNPLYTKRFAYFVGQRCRQATIKDVAKELALDWHTVKALEMQYMQAQLARAGTPGPQGRDPQGPHLPDRGERSGARPADLVRRRGSFGGEHGPVLHLARCEEEFASSPCGDGHVEALPLGDADTCAASGDFVRQVPRHAASGRGLGYGSQARVCAACGSRPPLYQGSEIHVAVAQGEPHARRQEGVKDAAGGQQAAQHRLRPQGELRPVVELRARGLGAAFLRELAREPQVAAARAV